MIKLTCLPLLAVLSFVSLNAYSEELDDLLRQQKSTKAEQRRVKGMDGVIEEYRSLLIFQIDDSGRLIRTSFQYKGSSDLVQYEAEPDLSQYISHALHSEYKIPQGCIDSG